MNKSTKILVTGGAGYIGSHCILKLLKLGYKNIISIDNFSNSKIKSIQKIEAYTGQKVVNENIDLRDAKSVQQFFEQQTDIETIIHFAALKDPFESIISAQTYYENNVVGLINLIKYSALTAVDKIIFSSSCAVYGEPISIPVNENHPINPQNPYANSKWICENILRDTAKERKLKVISLRYFNPIGSNARAGLKEYYDDKSKNIIPQIIRVIKGEMDEFPVYGNDLPTKDGSGIRDFIHVDDLVEAHISAMEFLSSLSGSYSYDVFNVGTGKGISVFELITEFNKQLGKSIKVKVESKRTAEVAKIYADSSQANKKIKWRAKKELLRMVNDILKSNGLVN